MILGIEACYAQHQSECVQVVWKTIIKLWGATDHLSVLATSLHCSAPSMLILC